eukprot:TCONS_00047256-protein
MRDYYYYGIANIPIAIIGFIINCLALYCMWKLFHNRGFGLSNANCFLLALNLWDTLTCLVIIPAKCAYYMENKCLDDQPGIFKYTAAINTYCSSFFIALIAFNRYLAFSRPFKHQSILTRERVLVLLAFALGMGLVVPIMLFFRLRCFRILCMIIAILLMCAILIFYGLILKSVEDSRSAVRSFRHNNENRIQGRQRRINLNVVMILTAYITSLSCQYGFVLNHMIKQTTQSQVDIDIGTLIYNMNCVCNPMIYVLRSSSYRRVLKNLFGCRRRRIRNGVRRNKIFVLELPQCLPAAIKSC